MKDSAPLRKSLIHSWKPLNDFSHSEMYLLYDNGVKCPKQYLLDCFYG